MKRKISLASAICAISIFCGCFLTVSAVDVVGEIYNNVGDTLSLSQEEYLASIPAKMARSTLSSQVVKATVETFLALSKASIRSTKSYDATALISNSDIEDDTIQYFLSEQDYQTKMREALSRDIIWDDLSYSDFTVEFDGDNASASVVETYKYYVNDDFDEESCRIREYFINLEYSQDGWRVTSLTTNDPWELESDFVYEAIDADSAVEQILADWEYAQLEVEYAQEREVANAEQANNISVVSTSAASLNKWTYNATTATTYASNNYSKTSNSIFGYTDKNDCQNFASQCVWAGLGGTSSATTRPAVTTAMVGSSSNRVWARNQSTTYYTNYVQNWGWDNVCGFFSVINSSSVYTEGPLGWVYHGELLNASQGDVIGWDTGGSPSLTSLDHAMFVTKVTGTSGLRTTSNIYIAAHTSATNSAYMALTDYASYSSSYYSTARVVSGYYSVSQ